VFWLTYIKKIDKVTLGNNEYTKDF